MQGNAAANMADAAKEATKMYKEANKLVNPSVLSFRFTAEWERATPLFEKASQLFRVGCPAGPRLPAPYQPASPAACLVVPRPA